MLERVDQRRRTWPLFAATFVVVGLLELFADADLPGLLVRPLGAAGFAVLWSSARGPARWVCLLWAILLSLDGIFGVFMGRQIT